MDAIMSVPSSALPALGPDWLKPDTLLEALGTWALWGAVAIIFAECGLLIGFFLPGDSLLFTVGLLITTGVIAEPLWLACLVLTVAAFVGNVVGYQIGRLTGPAVFSRPESKLFRREYVDKTTAFFDKYGNRAIVLARFVPIVRTFITVMAGVGRMDPRRYFLYSGIGAVLWATGVTLLGAALGQVSVVRSNIEVILLAIVAVSVIPVGIEFLRERAKSRNARP
jgi:membrane-associated protein